MLRRANHMALDGQGLVEYALIMLLVALVVVLVLPSVGQGLNAAFNVAIAAL